MDENQFHFFITSESKRDYDGDGQITHFDNVVRERLIERLMRYREKHKKPVLSVDLNPISQLQEYIGEIVDNMLDTHLS